jgi:hypothetical protein
MNSVDLVVRLRFGASAISCRRSMLPTVWSEPLWPRFGQRAHNTVISPNFDSPVHGVPVRSLQVRPADGRIAMLSGSVELPRNHRPIPEEDRLRLATYAISFKALRPRRLPVPAKVDRSAPDKRSLDDRAGSEDAILGDKYSLHSSLVDETVKRPESVPGGIDRASKKAAPACSLGARTATSREYFD